LTVTETGPPFHAIKCSNAVADILDTLLKATHNSLIIKIGYPVEAMFFASVRFPLPSPDEPEPNP
jgi:hypothetical protein